MRGIFIKIFYLLCLFGQIAFAQEEVDSADKRKSLMEQYLRLSRLMTDFGLAAFDLFEAASEGGGNKIDKKTKEEVLNFKKSFTSYMNEHQKKLTYTGFDLSENELKDVALAYGNYLLEITENLKIARLRKILRIVPQSINPNDDVERVITSVARVQYSVVEHFKKLHNSVSLLARAKDFFLYNVFSTKIMPWVIRAGGLAAGVGLTTMNIQRMERNYYRDLQEKEQRRNIRNAEIVDVLLDSKLADSAKLKQPIAQTKDQIDQFTQDDFEYILQSANRNYSWRQMQDRAKTLGDAKGEDRLRLLMQEDSELKGQLMYRLSSANKNNYDALADHVFKEKGYHKKDKFTYDPGLGDIAGEAAKTVAIAAAPLVITAGVAWVLGSYVHDSQVLEYEYRIKKAQDDAEKAKLKKSVEEKAVKVEGDISLAQVIGHEYIKKNDISVIIDFLKNPIKYKSQKSKNILSLLFYGPPGTGKTLMARAISGEAGAPFVSVSADDFLSEDSKDKLLAIWELANDAARKAQTRSAIIYIDEVDFVVGNREKEKLDTNKSRALSNLLAILDGIVKTNEYVHIVIIMTTNHLTSLDAALLRPGRIDKRIFIGLPNASTRKKLLQHLLPEENYSLIDQMLPLTSGLSPAHIVNIVESANRKAILQGMLLPDLDIYLKEIEQFSAIERREDLIEQDL